MKKPSVQFFIIGVGVVCLLAGILFSFFPTKENHTTSVAPTPQTASPAQINPILSQEPEPVSVSLPSGVPALPTELPIYQASFGTKPTLSVLSQLTDQLGFSGTPSAVLSFGILNAHLVSDQGDFSLSRQPSGTKTVAVTFEKNPPKINPSLPLEKQLINYLSVFGQPPTGVSLSITKTQRLPMDGLSFKNPPKGDLLTYQTQTLVDRSYPIFSEGYSDVSGFIIVDQEGNIRSVSYTLPPVAITKLSTATLIPYQDIPSNVAAGRGTTVSLTTDDGSEPVLNKTDPFTADSITIVYMRGETDNILYPTYSISGTYKNGTVHTTILLRADASQASN